MPRNGSNIYSPPAGTTATPNTPIESAKYNAFVADLTNDLNLARPIVAGGTGATTKSGAQQALDLEPGVDIQAYNAKLAALAALTLAADKLIYATGTNTLATSDLTTVARTLLAGANAAAMRTTLGLLGLAVKNKISVPGDIDATGTAGGTTFLRGDGAWAAVPAPTRSGPVSTASGTAAPFTGIAATANKIVITFDKVSLDGTGNLLVQLGTSGGYVTTGYESSGASNGSGTTATDGFIIRIANAGQNFVGHMTLTRIPGTNRWVESYNGFTTAIASYFSGGGVITLGGTLDRLQVVPTAGNFDAGQVSVEVSE